MMIISKKKKNAVDEKDIYKNMVKESIEDIGYEVK